MGTLVRPSALFHAAWLDAVSEPGYGPHWPDGLQLADLSEPGAFARYVDNLLRDEQADAPRPLGAVPSTHLWYIDDGVFLGRLSIRHRLTGWLRDYGGHVGYDVRPSARGRGHATAMLRQAKPWLAHLGIDPALVTCDVDNVASRTVIERAGGNLEDVRSGKLRFWVPVSS